MSDYAKCLSLPRCECGEEFETGDIAVAHVSQTLHFVHGLYFSHRMRAEEIRHAHGFCTHVSERLDGGYRTICIARTPVVPAGRHP